MPLWQELPLLLIVAFCLAVLIRTFLLQAFFIPSGSMETTLLVGDRVLVNKVVYDVRDPQRGEIVVFRGPDRWAPENRLQPEGGALARAARTVGDLVGLSQPGEKDFIKRVIGLPGDTVACCDASGNVIVNGQPLDELGYVSEDRNSPTNVPQVPGQCGSREFAPVVVGSGQIFVMGDHRRVSQDSRCQGTVPIANVIGRAFVIVWPSKRWTGLGIPRTFEKVPKRAAAASRPGLPLSPAAESPVVVSPAAGGAGVVSPAAGGAGVVSPGAEGGGVVSPNTDGAGVPVSHGGVLGSLAMVWSLLASLVPPARSHAFGGRARRRLPG